MKQENYIITGGQLGKSRLNLLSTILEDHTKRFLNFNSDHEGISFLDLGCGGGNVSRMVAEMIGVQGKVEAVDFDSEMIDLNNQDLQKSGLLNTTFKCKSAYEIDNKEEFDVTYSRFLLSHLEFPEEALKKMVEATKVGGKVYVEDINFDASFCHPTNEDFYSYVRLYISAAMTNKHNPQVGIILFDMFNKLGLVNIKINIIQPCYNDGIGKWMAHLTLDRIKNTVIKQNLINENDFCSVLDGIKSFTENPHTIISLPRIFQVVGEKK